MEQTTNLNSKRTFVYAGAGNRIQGYELQANGSLRQLSSVSFPGHSPGWFTFDQESKRVFVTDGFGGRLAAYVLDTETGTLTLEKVMPFVSHSVHLHMHRNPKTYEFAGASYDLATYGRATWSDDLETYERTHTLHFRDDSKTHSSSFAPNRQLIFVSNLGDDRIHIYRLNDHALEKASEIHLPNPRIVHYDAHFDRLYVTTEAYSDRSYVKIYEFKESLAGGPLLNEVSSFAMALSGGDLRIDYRHGYLAATVREEGEEGLWLLPLTKEGHLDVTRDRHFIRIPHLKPRSLQVTASGQFYIIACDDPKNKKDLVIVQLHFDASDRHIVHAEIVESLKLDGAPILANLLIEPN